MTSPGLEAVDPGQPYVEQHELDRMTAKLDERVLTATHPQHLVTLAAQVGAHKRADIRLVLDDQDRGRHGEIVGAQPDLGAALLHAADLYLTVTLQASASVSVSIRTREVLK